MLTLTKITSDAGLVMMCAGSRLRHSYHLPRDQGTELSSRPPSLINGSPQLEYGNRYSPRFWQPASGKENGPPRTHHTNLEKPEAGNAVSVRHATLVECQAPPEGRRARGEIEACRWSGRTQPRRRARRAAYKGPPPPPSGSMDGLPVASWARRATVRARSRSRAARLWVARARANRRPVPDRQGPDRTLGIEAVSFWPLGCTPTLLLHMSAFGATQALGDQARHVRRP